MPNPSEPATLSLALVQARKTQAHALHQQQPTMLRAGLVAPLATAVATCMSLARQRAVRALSSSAARYPPEWAKRATKEIGGKELSSLEVTTPEGIKMKPVYTKDDVDYNAVSQEPGVYPYTRGCARLSIDCVRASNHRASSVLCHACVRAD